VKKFNHKGRKELTQRIQWAEYDYLNYCVLCGWLCGLCG